MMRKFRGDSPNEDTALKLQIRGMAECDVDSVANLEKQCFSKPWSRESLERELHNDFAFFDVAVLDKKVVGYLGVYEIAQEGYITNIAVDRQYRNMGIAKRLLDYAISGCIMRRVSFITLEVRASNNKAISLYRSKGFAKVGIRVGFYTNPTEDAILMTKQIGGNHENTCD